MITKLISQNRTMKINTASSNTLIELDKKDVVRNEKVKPLNYILLHAVHHPDAAGQASGENLNAICFEVWIKNDTDELCNRVIANRFYARRFCRSYSSY